MSEQFVESNYAQLVEKFGPAVEQDRKKYLAGFNPRLLQKGSLMDLHHQTLLRLWSQHEDVNQGDIQEYLVNPQKKLSVLLLLQKHYSADKSLALYSHEIRAGMRLNNSDVEKLIIALGSNENLPDETATAFFANHAGFGVFQTLPYDRTPEITRVMNATGNVCSVGAAMYYAFNTSSETAYVQSSSIKTLACALDGLSKVDRVTSPVENRIKALMIDSIDDLGAPSELCIHLEAMFAFHEIGHRPHHPGHEYLHELLQLHPMQLPLFYSGFPKPHDLGAWSRIKNGDGSLKELLFLLGDTLANLAFLQTCTDRGAIASLRVFLGWLVKEPTKNTAPRGNNALLSALLNRDIAQALRDVEKLISECMHSPQTMQNTLYDFETKHWIALKEKLSELGAQN